MGMAIDDIHVEVRIGYVLPESLVEEQLKQIVTL